MEHIIILCSDISPHGNVLLGIPLVHHTLITYCKLAFSDGCCIPAMVFRGGGRTASHVASTTSSLPHTPPTSASPPLPHTPLVGSSTIRGTPEIIGHLRTDTRRQMGEDEGSVSGTSRMNSKGSSTPPPHATLRPMHTPYAMNPSYLPGGGGGRRCMRVQTRATHIRMYKSGRGGGARQPMGLEFRTRAGGGRHRRDSALCL